MKKRVSLTWILGITAVVAPVGLAAEPPSCELTVRVVEARLGKAGAGGPREAPRVRLLPKDGARSDESPRSESGELVFETRASGSRAPGLPAWHLDWTEQLAGLDPTAFEAQVLSPGLWTPPMPLADLCGRAVGAAGRRGTEPAEVLAVRSGWVQFAADPVARGDGEPPGAIDVAFGFAPGAVRLEETAASREWISGSWRADCERVEGERTPPEAPSDSGPWLCEVPAASLDLRIESVGAVPHYFWDRPIEPATVASLGRLHFEPGASVAGWVELGARADPAAGAGEELEGSGSALAEIRLEPQVTGWIEDPAQLTRLARKAHVTRVNERGFFQVRGVPAGVFELTASQSGYTDATVEAIRAEEGREHVIREPIRLEPPLVLDLFIDPPLDAGGRPWLVELVLPKPGTQVAKVHARSLAGPSGDWQAAGMPEGAASLVVHDQDGSVWWQEAIDVRRDMAPVFAEIGAVEVRGTVLMGDQPLAAELVFGTRHRRPHVSLRSDSEGRFRGVLPRSGDWRLEVGFGGDFVGLESVAIHPPDGGGPATVEVRVPDTEVRVEVTESGRPLARVTVLVKTEDGERRGAGRLVGEDGQTTVRGLAPGRYVAVAYDRGRTSPPVRFELTKDSSAPKLEIEMGRAVRVAGTIRHAGRGVPGARVMLFADSDDPMASYSESVSDALGAFEMKVATESNAGSPGGVDMIWAGKGLGAVIERRPIVEGRSVEVELLSEKGEILIENPALLESFLVHAGAAVPMRRLLGNLLGPDPAGRGLLLGSLRPGRYSLCPARIPGPGCQGGELGPAGTLVFR